MAYSYPNPYAQPSGYPGYPAPSAYNPQPQPPPYSAVSAPIARSYFYIRSRLSGLVFDIEGASRSPGARVIMWSQKGSGSGGDSDNQLWYDDFATGTIRSKMHDFCLDVDRDTVVVNPFYPSNFNQLWEKAEPFIRSRLAPNKVLDVAGSSNQPGARLIVYERNGGLNQCFDYHYLAAAPAALPPKPAMKIPKSTAIPRRPRFYIVSEMNGKVMDIEGGNTQAGARVIMWPKKPGQSRNQLWYFDQGGIIRSDINDFALEAKATSTSVTMMPFKGNPHQRWSLVGNRIMKNQCECLDICGADQKDGAAVISYGYKGSVNQHWRIEYV